MTEEMQATPIEAAVETTPVEAAPVEVSEQQPLALNYVDPVGEIPQSTSSPEPQATPNIKDILKEVLSEVLPQQQAKPAEQEPQANAPLTREDLERMFQEREEQARAQEQAKAIIQESEKFKNSYASNVAQNLRAAGVDLTQEPILAEALNSSLNEMIAAGIMQVGRALMPSEMKQIVANHHAKWKPTLESKYGYGTVKTQVAAESLSPVGKATGAAAQVAANPDAWSALMEKVNKGEATQAEIIKAAYRLN